jgi:hypothetical protein
MWNHGDRKPEYHPAMCWITKDTSPQPKVPPNKQCDIGALPPPPVPPPPVPPAPADAKHVLYLLVDDLRTQTTVYNHSYMQTPHLQALADASLVFEQAHVQSQMCVPTRNSFLTGRRPEMTTVFNDGIGENDTAEASGFRAAPGGAAWTTLPGYFKRHGYFVTGVGKSFHPNKPRNFDQPYSWSEELPYSYPKPYQCPNPTDVWCAVPDGSPFEDEEILAEASDRLTCATRPNRRSALSHLCTVMRVSLQVRGQRLGGRTALLPGGGLPQAAHAVPRAAVLPRRAAAARAGTPMRGRWSAPTPPVWRVLTPSVPARADGAARAPRVAAQHDWARVVLVPGRGQAVPDQPHAQLPRHRAAGAAPRLLCARPPARQNTRPHRAPPRLIASVPPCCRRRRLVHRLAHRPAAGAPRGARRGGPDAAPLPCRPRVPPWRPAAPGRRPSAAGSGLPHGRYQLGERNVYCKETNFNLATHVPFMIRAPFGQYAGAMGRRTARLVEVVDVMPTLIDMARSGTHTYAALMLRYSNLC